MWTGSGAVYAHGAIHAPTLDSAHVTTAFNGGVVGTNGAALPGSKPNDRGFEITNQMSTERMRELYSTRAWVEAQGINNLTIQCQAEYQDGSGNCFRNTPAVLVGADRAGDEIIAMPSCPFRDAIQAGTPLQQAINRANVAAIIWHEVMHSHNYLHCSDAAGLGLTEAECAAFRRQQAPNVVGACLRQVLINTANLKFGPGCPACAPGFFPVQATFDGGTCGCVSDPGLPTSHSPTNVSTYNTSTAQTLVANSYGTAYLTNGSQLLKWNGAEFEPTFIPFIENSLILAGGDSLVTYYSGIVCAFGGGLRRFGPNDLLETCIDIPFGSFVTMDDFGTIYVENSGVYRILNGTSTMQYIGGPAASIVAGGDRMFATDPSNGSIWAFHNDTLGWDLVGSAGAQFDVDAFGTLYGLAPDSSAIFRNRGSYWDWFGSTASGFRTGNFVYARNPTTLMVNRRYSGAWREVSVCHNYAAGGSSFFCLTNGGNVQTVKVFADN